MKIYKFVYSYYKQELLRIFDQKFVKENKYKWKIIHKNKMFPLQSIFRIIENKNEKFKFKLIYYNHIQNINKKSYYVNEEKETENSKNIINCEYIDSLLDSSHEIKKFIYKIDNEDKIKIFGENFVLNNDNKCLIRYKNKIFPLQIYFLLKNIYREDEKKKILK